MKQRDVWKRVLANAAVALVICATLASFLRLYQNSHAAAPVARAATTPTVGTDNWPTYLYGNDHQGVNPNETTIGAANVSSLVTKWKFPPLNNTSELVAEPIVANGILYEGSWNGYMYAFNATTGQPAWQAPAYLGTYRSKQCGPRGGPSGSATYDYYNNYNNYKDGLIFVGSGPYMFALDATTGIQVWETKLGTAKDTKDNYSDHIWGSATVANGIVYVGIASLCDNPLTQGILYALDEATGAIVSRVDIVPKVNPGGGIWDAPTVDPVTGTVIVTTGSIGKGNDPISPMEAAVVTLNWQTNANNVKTLTVNQFWQVPAPQRQNDADFGSSPTLFSSSSGVRYFGVINKNSIYYVFNEADVIAGPVWQSKIGLGGNVGGLQGSITTSDYFNNVLYITTSLATVGGISYNGSISAFKVSNVSNGNLTLILIWSFGTPGHFYAAPVIANGLLYDVQGSPGNPNGNLFEIRDLASGAVLFPPPSYKSPFKSPIEASPTVVNGMVYIATFNGTLYALKPTA